jgi:outer membrane protein
VATTRAQVAFAARLRFAEWRQALAMETVARDVLAAQAKNAEVTQQFFDVGKVPRFDVLRAQAAEAAAQQQLANAQAEVTAAQANLAQALGVPAETLGQAADEQAAIPPDDPLELALARRPELLAARQTIQATEAIVQARQAGYRPQVFAFGMVGVMTPSDMGKSAGYSLGVGAGLPILDGGRRKAEVEEARQAVAQAQATRDNMELQVRAEVAGARARVTAARQNIDTAAAQVKAAEEAYRVAQARYEAGRSNIVELLDARQALTEAQQSLVSAQAQYRATLAALYRAIGWDMAP